jgi:hypothetical protein
VLQVPLNRASSIHYLFLFLFLATARIAKGEDAEQPLASSKYIMEGMLHNAMENIIDQAVQ